MSNVEYWHPIWHLFFKIYKGSQIGAKLDAKFGVLAPIHNLAPFWHPIAYGYDISGKILSGILVRLTF